MAAVTTGVRCSYAAETLLCEMAMWGPQEAALGAPGTAPGGDLEQQGGHRSSHRLLSASARRHSPGQVEGVVDNLRTIDGRDNLERETV